MPGILDFPLDAYEPHHYNQSFTNSAFLAEFPDQPAHTGLLDDREQQDGWTTDTNIPAPVLHATDHYVWEGSTYDCSLTNSVAVSLPSAHLLRLLTAGAYVRDGAVRTPDGDVIAFAPPSSNPANTPSSSAPTPSTPGSPTPTSYSGGSSTRNADPAKPWNTTRGPAGTPTQAFTSTSPPPKAGRPRDLSIATTNTRRADHAQELHLMT
ncbi:hypothetical protein [Saccharothrix yanglingensis]|uniref:hypothetical protein n=1 Tax=Saccharothrix yanglingensis TaxID=659496 RepID=UPI0027D26B99|nr:hypothetical protein [Saccharothrix yanglingensis]